MKQIHLETTNKPRRSNRPLVFALFLGALCAGYAGAPNPAGESTTTKNPTHQSARAAEGMWFPGPPPGNTKTAAKGGEYVLENGVIAARWQIEGGVLRPAALANKLSATSFDQTGAELFRLGLRLSPECKAGCVVAVRLDPDKVVALASDDGLSWSELGAFPRADFDGEPKLVRIGKMDLRAQSRDYAGPAGATGRGSITELSPLQASLPSGRFDFNAEANHAATAEYAFPSGARMISCRIDKGTDAGMSWSPALALVWEEGKRFLLV